MGMSKGIGGVGGQGGGSEVWVPLLAKRPASAAPLTTLAAASDSDPQSGSGSARAASGKRKRTRGEKRMDTAEAVKASLRNYLSSKDRKNARLVAFTKI